MSNGSISPIDKTLSGTTILSQSGLGSNGNEGVLHIPQISKAGASPSEDLRRENSKQTPIDSFILTACKSLDDYFMFRG